MTTLKEFREYVLRVSEMSYGDFCSRSPKHQAFCQKLNMIGSRNIKDYPEDNFPPDIDATVILTPQEEESLRGEFYSLNLNPKEEVVN
jgi:hypothetical protein